MTRLAILILKSDDLVAFEATLASVLANRPRDCVVLALCPGGYDDPYDLSSEVTFVEAGRDATDAELVTLALEHVDDDCRVVHTLVSGLEVDEGWTEPAVDCFEDGQIGAVAPLVIRRTGEIDSAGIRLSLAGELQAAAAGRMPGKRRFRPRMLGPALGAAFYRRTVLEGLGGFDTTFAKWLADADLAATMREAGYRIALSVDSRVIGELAGRGEVSTFQRGQLKERFFWKHCRSSPGLLLHPLLVITELAGRSPISSLLGRLVGLIRAPFDARRRVVRQGRRPRARPTGPATNEDAPEAAPLAKRRAA